MDWNKLIAEMIERGETQASIGRLSGMTGANVRALLGNPGQSPNWAAGQKLIDLHKRVTRKYPKIDAVA